MSTTTCVNRKGIEMDYGKSGASKPGKKAPRHKEHNAKGTAKNPFGTTATKADLIARLKAAADARKKG